MVREPLDQHDQKTFLTDITICIKSIINLKPMDAPDEQKRNRTIQICQKHDYSQRGCYFTRRNFFTEVYYYQKARTRIANTERKKITTETRIRTARNHLATQLS